MTSNIFIHSNRDKSLVLESTLSLGSLLSSALGLALLGRSLGSDRGSRSLGGGDGSSSSGSSSSSRSSRGLAGNGSSATRGGARAGTLLVVGAVTVAGLAGEVGGVVSAGVGPRSGSGSIVVGNGRVVDAEEEARVGGLESTRELDERRRLASTVTVNGDLGTTDVELSTVLLASTVETDVLSAHEVGTLGGILGESEGEVVDTARLAVHVVGPLDALSTNALPGHLVDLEPVAITEVVGSLSAIGSLAEVDGEGTGVAHLGDDGETDLIAGGDLHGLGSGADVLVETASVADDVLGGDIGDRTVVVGGLSDVLVILSDLAVDNKSREVVVGESGRKGGGKGQNGGE